MENKPIICYRAIPKKHWIVTRYSADAQGNNAAVEEMGEWRNTRLMQAAMIRMANGEDNLTNEVQCDPITPIGSNTMIDLREESSLDCYSEELPETPETPE